MALYLMIFVAARSFWSTLVVVLNWSRELGLEGLGEMSFVFLPLLATYQVDLNMTLAIFYDGRELSTAKVVRVSPFLPSIEAARWKQNTSGQAHKKTSA